jgi:hypothetical protein
MSKNKNMAKEPIRVVNGGGGIVADDRLGNTEHRQQVLAEMQNMGMGAQAEQLSKEYNVTLPKTTTATASQTAGNTTPTPTAPNTPSVPHNYNDVDGAISEVNDRYDDMVAESNKFYNAQINNINSFAAKQAQLQQERTDFEVKKIEQQKEETRKNYEKERQAAYTDYQKEINPYGVNAEYMASQGMSGTGYAESSRVKMFTAYQNRVAVAKQTYDQAVINFNNAMTEAQLQNNSALAQLAFNTFQQTLELAFEGFMRNNELITQKANERLQLEQIYYQREQDRINNLRADEQWNRTLEQDEINTALQKLSIGDYSGIKALGWTVDENRLNYDFNSAQKADLLKEAELSAQYGDFEPLERLGIKVSPEFKEGFKNKLLNTSTNGYDFSDIDDYDLPATDNETTEAKTAMPTAKTVISTPFYNDVMDKDTFQDAIAYGTFKTTTDNNGVMYQPKGIGAYGKVRDTGETMLVNTEILYGENKGKPLSLEQKIWRTPDGSEWYWEGRLNKYVLLSGPEIPKIQIG